MEVKYEKNRVQEIFVDHTKLIKNVGMETAKALKKRVNQIKASVNFQRWLDARLGTPHRLTGNSQGYYGVSLTPNMRLVLKPETNDYSPESLSKCTIVVVKGVCDYHGDKTNWLIS